MSASPKIFLYVGKQVNFSPSDVNLILQCYNVIQWHKYNILAKGAFMTKTLHPLKKKKSH